MTTSQTYEIKLTWLNSFGGWEYWNFLAKKTHGYNIRKEKNGFVERDVFQSWDTDFIAGNSQKETIRVRAAKTVTVRSQLLTEQQIEAIAKINLSISVRDVTEDTVVIVDSKTFSYRTDGDKLHQIEFNIL